MKKIILVVLFFVVWTQCSYNQNVIWLLNSDHIEINKFSIDTIKRVISYTKKNGKVKFIPFDHIYSITDSSGMEKIYYHKHPQDSTSLSVEDMYWYLKGSDDAYNNYKNPAFYVGGFVTGALSGYSFVHFGVLPTVVYPVVIGLTSPSEKKIIKRNPEYAQNQYYIKGYKEAGANKRTWSSLVGAFSGFAAGLTIILIIAL
ncbi:MAG: hypothetical protein Kow0068_12470 [Marinilabiliales bacterium]